MIIKTKCRMGNACVIRAGGKPDDECMEFCHYNRYVVPSKADKIRSMSDEELAEYLASVCEKITIMNHALETAPDKDSWLEWLRGRAI